MTAEIRTTTTAAATAALLPTGEPQVHIDPTGATLYEYHALDTRSYEYTQYQRHTHERTITLSINLDHSLGQIEQLTTASMHGEGAPSDHPAFIDFRLGVTLQRFRSNNLMTSFHLTWEELVTLCRMAEEWVHAHPITEPAATPAESPDDPPF